MLQRVPKLADEGVGQVNAVLKRLWKGADKLYYDLVGGDELM